MQTTDLQTEIKKQLLQLGNTLLEATESEEQTFAVLNYINALVSNKERQIKIKSFIEKIQKNPKMGEMTLLSEIIKLR